MRDHFRAVRAKKPRSKPYVPKPEGDPSRVREVFCSRAEVPTRIVSGAEGSHATSLARLWHRQGKFPEARALLSPVYAWFNGPARGDAVCGRGDWHYSHKGLEIRVPRGLSDEEIVLVMVPELVESFLVRHDGVHEAAVNAFDQAHADADEAGALSAAPYHDEHAAATKVERKLAPVVGVRWATYDRDTDRTRSPSSRAPAAHGGSSLSPDEQRPAGEREQRACDNELHSDRGRRGSVRRRACRTRTCVAESRSRAEARDGI